MNAMTKIEPTTHDRDAYGQMTIAELLDVHNDLAERCGTDVLKSWKRAKPELIDRIEALDGRLDVRQADTHEPEATEDAEPTDHEADDTPEQPKRTIGALVEELLMDEALGYEAIVDLVKAEFTDAKTSARSVASVAAVLRKKGVDVPLRRKSKS